MVTIVDEYYLQGQETSLEPFHAVMETAENLQTVNHRHLMHQDNQPTSKA